MGEGQLLHDAVNGGSHLRWVGVSTVDHLTRGEGGGYNTYDHIMNKGVDPTFIGRE